MKAKSIAVLGVVIIIGFLVLQASGRLPFLDQWLNYLNPFKPEREFAISDAIITDIKQVSQLTTTIYTIQMVVPKKNDKDKDILVMVIKGHVEAGLDLKELDKSDVSESEDGKNITVDLPPVKILTKRDHILSSNAKETYRYSQGRITNKKANDYEAEVRGQGNHTILVNACKEGILKDATEDAKYAIENFLKVTQPNVNITVESAPVPSELDCIYGDLLESLQPEQLKVLESLPWEVLETLPFYEFPWSLNQD